MQKQIKTICLGLPLVCLTGFWTSTLNALSAHTELGSKDLITLLDFDIAYGARLRVSDRDPEIIGVGNGGVSINPSYDNGNLNYDQGKPVANMVRGSGELTLLWGNFGAFVRAYAYYDFENEGNDRARTELTSEALEQVGSDVLLLDAYLSARFVVNAMPLQFRLGQQVVNWGESRFFSGVNVINPLNVPLFQQPMGLVRDLRKPVGTLWGSLQFSPVLAVEAYYQYEWQETVLPGQGTYLSGVDAAGPGSNIFNSGPWSDQGTDPDAAFGLPPGTIGDGFDPYWFAMPRGSDDTPSDQGQYGISLQILAPKLNDTKFALSYANYHSKVPLLGGISPPLDAYLNYTKQAVQAETKRLVSEGVDPATAGSAAYSAAFDQFLKKTQYVMEYPEDIQMLGVSFNTTSLATGTALFGELSHHLDTPIPIVLNQVMDTALPDATPEDPFALVDLEQNPPADIAANYASKPVDMVEYVDRTFLALGATQLFGPQLGASQTTLTAEIGWEYIWDFPAKDELLIAAPGITVPQTKPNSIFADGNNWGYRLLASLTYNNVFGGMTLRPRFGFSHDVSGTSPLGTGPFLEGGKSLTVGLAAEYIKRIKADISYKSFWGADQYNVLNDRDYLNFNVRYYF